MNQTTSYRTYSLTSDKYTISILVIFLGVIIVCPCVLFCGRIIRKYLKSNYDYLL
jgi:hypothetical protein